MVGVPGFDNVGKEYVTFTLIAVIYVVPLNVLLKRNLTLMLELLKAVVVVLFLKSQSVNSQYVLELL